MTRLRMRVAERLKAAQNTYALLTTFNEVDMSALMALRETYKDAFAVSGQRDEDERFKETELYSQQCW